LHERTAIRRIFPRISKDIVVDGKEEHVEFSTSTVIYEIGPNFTDSTTGKYKTTTVVSYV